MNIEEISVGNRVLIQRSSSLLEHATVKALQKDGTVIVKLSDNKITEIHPQYILKKFN